MSIIGSPSEQARQRLIDRFWETIPPMWNRIRGRIRGTAAEKFGITVEQFHILRHIRKGFRSMGELAQEKQISRPAISQAVEILVEKGLITRSQSSEDRRFVQLELTPSGNELLNSIFQTNRAWMMEKISALTLEEVETILCAMDAFQKAFDDSQPAP